MTRRPVIISLQSDTCDAGRRQLWVINVDPRYLHMSAHALERRNSGHTGTSGSGQKATLTTCWNPGNLP